MKIAMFFMLWFPLLLVGHQAEAASALSSKQLIDSQNLLEPKQQAEIAALLDYHNEDAAIELRVCLLGEDQAPPTELMEEIGAEARPMAWIVFYYGNALRSECHHLGKFPKTISAREQKRALESAIVQAGAKQDHYEQLLVFLEQMSVRVYLMEQILDGREKEFVSERVSKATKKKRSLPQIPEQFLSIGIAVALVMVCLLFLWLLRWWRVTHSKYVFPEAQTEARMGGKNAAGIGAVISFHSADLPPSSQREQGSEIVVRR
jgi:hypothetical protein